MNDINVEWSYIFELYSGKDLEFEELGGVYIIRINFKIYWIFFKGGWVVNKLFIIYIYKF